MIPFPGESLAIFRAAMTLDTGTTWIEDRVTYRTGYDGGAETDVGAVDGAAFRAWVEPGTADYLEAAEPVAVSWVVEIVGGTLNVNASEGLDPDYGNTDAATPITLGTHSADGATLVIPSTFTADDVLDAAGALTLRIDVLPGSSTFITQIKLRVWPTAGAAGGWVTRDGFDTNPQDVVPAYAAENDLHAYIEDDPPAAAWGDGYDTFKLAVQHLAQNERARDFYPAGSPSVYAERTLTRQGVEPDLFGMEITVSPFLVLLRGADWADQFPIAGDLTEGADWTRPPTEVNGDWREYARQLDDGSTGWLNATVRADITGDLPTGPTVWAGAADIPLTQVVGGGLGAVTATLPIPLGGLVYPSQVNDLPTDGRVIYVVGSHSITIEPNPVWPGVTPSVLDSYTHRADLTFTLGDVRTFARMPPYQAWSPTAPKVRKLRQLHRDDGLGGTPPRAFGGASRNRTQRAYGYT